VVNARRTDVPARRAIQQPMLKLLTRLLADETGQDLIEYALLTGAIGFAGVVGVNLLGAAINTTYSSWDTGVNSLWEVPPPQSTP
jgi:Flp pilus assembly pilin Flp